jgi:putative FmdB family regulatory protein
MAMPLYVYKCNDCEYQFEIRQRFSEEPLSDCPQCVGPIRRVINPVGVVFKGSGFYVTDSRNGKSTSLVNGKGHTEDKSEKTENGKASETGAPESASSASTTAAPAAKSDGKPSAGTSAA